MRNAEKWRPIREQSGPSELWGVASVDASGRIVETIIRPTTKLDGEDADTIARAHNARLSRPDQIYTESIVSHRTGEPVYRFVYGEVSWEMGLRQLRQFINDLYELAEAGLTDAFLAKFVSRRLGVIDEGKYAGTMAALMQDFRSFREELRSPVAEPEESAAAS
jgi:hypothetical protein